MLSLWAPQHVHTKLATPRLHHPGPSLAANAGIVHVLGRGRNNEHSRGLVDVQDERKGRKSFLTSPPASQSDSVPQNNQTQKLRCRPRYCTRKQRLRMLSPVQ